MQFVAIKYALSVIPLLILPSVSASARPRDEVMSRAFRCASIDDARTWLDCYYGAAQPARSALSLPPGPAAQSQLSLTQTTVTGPPQDVATRNRVLSDAFSCNGLDDDRRWLNCYYAAAEYMRSDLGLRPLLQGGDLENGAGHPPISDVPKAPEQDFGLIDDSKHINSIFSRIASYSFDKERFFTVGLSNGQVWRQVSGDTTYAHWKGAPESHAVRVSRGFLGSFNLQVRNSPGLFKVHRLQ
jgi:hypothetical protein